MLGEETTALRQRDRVGKNLADICQATTGFANQVVANAQQGFALDLHIRLQQKIVVFHHRTGERILDGDDRCTDLTALHQSENLRGNGAGNDGRLGLHL